MSYLNRHTNHSFKTQRDKLNTRQVENNAGGYVFQVSPLDRLRRFLIIGSEGGTYYVSEKNLTLDNLSCVDNCLETIPKEAIDLVVEVSEQGLAPKNDQAILVLAKACCHKDVKIRQYAWAQLHKVCRIGTHLYQFAEFYKHFEGGWGSLPCRSIGGWFLNMSESNLAYQVSKYKERGKWSARDLLRLAHPKTDNVKKNAILKWVVQKGGGVENLPEYLQACNQVKNASVQEAVVLINKYRLPWEVLPTNLLNSPEIWESLLPDMGITALVRNLGKMTAIGTLRLFSENVQKVVDKLTNEELVKLSRIHPFQAYVALSTYSSGHGVKGSLSWEPIPAIKDALEKAFYLAFKNVEPTGKKTLLALDVSGSMAITAFKGISAAEISAVMAMVTLRSEPNNCHVMGFSENFKSLGISATDNLESIAKKVYDSNFGRTDCAVPMIWAMKNNIPVDTFVIYTDNETWYGDKHPIVALKEYREKMGVDAKLVVVGITATDFTIADPEDKGSLDVCGFDSSTPQVISNFSRGLI